MIGRPSTQLWLALAAGLLLCGGVARPASAQTREGSPQESTRIMLQFAECTVKTRKFRPDVDRFLRTSPSDPEFGTLGRSFVRDSCVSVGFEQIEMRFDPVLFRYSLFEARYRTEFGKGPPPSVVGLPPLNLDSEFDLTITRGLQGVAPLPPLIIFMRSLSECVIRQKPAEAHALIVAKPYTPAETMALDAVRQMLAECTPEGHTLTFSRPMLRGAIAEALYKAATYTGPRAPAQTQSVN